MHELHPNRVVIMAVDPRSGQILAETGRTQNPYLPKELATTWAMEPGESFMPFPLAGALEEEYIKPTSCFDCGNGVWMFAGCVIRDHRSNGMLDVAGILQKSSKIGAAKIGAMLSPACMDHYAGAFGFGHRTQVSKANESSGYILPSGSRNERTKLLMSCGESVKVTPIQLVMAYSALANDGMLLKPKSDWIVGPSSVQQSVSPKTAQKILEMLRGVVHGKDGTAPLARVEGADVWGKTGSSAHGNTLIFVGGYPVERPRIVCLVAVERPDVPTQSRYAGLICAPIFSHVMKVAAKMGF